MNDHRPAILLDEAEARWRWTHGYVENVAAAIALAVTDERASGRIYNTGEEEAFPLADWVHQIGQAVGWKGRIVTVPQGQLTEPLAVGINAAQDIIVDTPRIRREAWLHRASPPQRSVTAHHRLGTGKSAREGQPPGI